VAWTARTSISDCPICEPQDSTCRIGCDPLGEVAEQNYGYREARTGTIGVRSVATTASLPPDAALNPAVLGQGGVSVDRASAGYILVVG